jgi:Holliday junction resolvasome RuvABC endonuclease subunit
MCVSTKPGWENARFWYLTTVKKQIGVFFDGQIQGDLHKEYTNDQQRYEDISQHFMVTLSFITTPQIPVFIEDYSFGSTGRVFGLAENTGLMKYKLWRRGHDIEAIPPTVIKKYASGKGNADKQGMYDAFMKQTGVNLVASLTPDKKLGSPVTDIVDAHFIAEYGHDLIKKVGI